MRNLAELVNYIKKKRKEGEKIYVMHIASKQSMFTSAEVIKIQRVAFILIKI